MELTKDTRDRIFAAADSLYEQAGRAAFPTVDAVRKTAKVNMNDASAGMKEWRRAQTCPDHETERTHRANERGDPRGGAKPAGRRRGGRRSTCGSVRDAVHLYRTPFRITKTTRFVAEISRDGSPSVAMKSAS